MGHPSRSALFRSSAFGRIIASDDRVGSPSRAIRSAANAARAIMTPQQVVVAIATPKAPSLGMPKKPKIKTASSRALRTLATTTAANSGPARPTLERYA
jgi:hypothetical protein